MNLRKVVTNRFFSCLGEKSNSLIMQLNSLTSKAHTFGSLILSLFILAHLTNHLMAWAGIEVHQQTMDALRAIYRHPIGETILMLSILIQVITGILHIRRTGWKQTSLFAKLQVYSGAYLCFFLLAHTTAIWNARLLLDLETGFHFGAIVWLVQPYKYIFGLYYLLGILSFFTHIACTMRWMLMNRLGNHNTNLLAWGIILIGGLIWILIALVFSGYIYEIHLPEEYTSYLP